MINLFTLVLTLSAQQKSFFSVLLADKIPVIRNQMSAYKASSLFGTQTLCLKLKHNHLVVI